MTDIQNPTALSDYDFLEFEGFVCKVDSEGFAYAYDNYSPNFEDPDMQAIADDMGKLRAFYRENVGVVEEWWATVGGENACELHNAHVDEERRREADACLWGVRCTDGYVVHEMTEADRDAFVERALGNPSYRQPEALLHRSTAGGPWVAGPLVRASA